MSVRPLAGLITCLLLSITASPAVAMYNPSIGRYLQRDPLVYPDGLNSYEYVRSNAQAHRDPSGLAAEPAENTEPADDADDCCKCVSIEIEILDKNWTVYDVDQVRREPEGRPVWRLGARIRSTFTVKGNIGKCKFAQDESGPGDRARAGIAHDYEHGSIRRGKWEGRLDGIDNPIESTNPYSVWSDKEGTVIYTDPMGKDHNHRNKRYLFVNVRLAATARCTSSDGSMIERDFDWGNRVDGVIAYAYKNDAGKFVTKGVGASPTSSVGEQRSLEPKEPE